MNKKLYIIPPKLHQQLLFAGGLTVWELLIVLALILFNLIRHAFFDAVFFSMTYTAIVARIFDGKSLKDMSMILLRYHSGMQFFSKSQQIKKGSQYAKRTHQ